MAIRSLANMPRLLIPVNKNPKTLNLGRLF